MLVVYSNNTTEFSNLGLGILKDFKSEPEITEVLNGLYNLEFDYAKDGWLSEYLIQGNIIKANNQLFRIRTINKDIKGTKITILAKHIWFDLELNNWLEDVAPTNKLGHQALDWILNHAELNTNFTINGDCTKVESARYVRMNPIEAVYTADNALLNRFGGEIEINNYNIFLHNRRGSDTGIEIRQKKNVKGATYSVDLSSLATRIMPVGKDGLLLPEKYVDSPLINNYYAPFYYKLDVDIGIDENKGITAQQCYVEMRKAANALFNSGIDKPNISIAIDFVELSKTKEYANYSNLETAHLGDSCHIHIPDLDINVTARIVKTVYNCSKKRITKIELGTPMINYVSNNNSNANAIKNTLSKIDTTSILNQAKSDATNLINHPFNGHIWISESTGELYVTDTTDLNTAQNIWKLGLGGFGHTSGGINGTYDVAMTMDGKIVADFITSGHLDTSVIQGYGDLEISVQDYENNGVRKSNVINSINMSTEEIFILASKLRLEGLTTINGAFIIDANGNPIINGGDITLIDTGNNSDPKIEIYDSTALDDAKLLINDKLNGLTLKFNWPSIGTVLTTDDVLVNKNLPSLDGLTILESSGGYSIKGGYYSSYGGSEYYTLYKNNTVVEYLYSIYFDEFDPERDISYGEVYKSVSSITLPNDFGTITSINANSGVYDYILASNVKKKVTTFKSSGIKIVDKNNNVSTSYGSNGLEIYDNNGSKYFNENGLSYHTPYGRDFAEFTANREAMLYSSGSSMLMMDCIADNHINDKFYININGDEKIRVDKDGVKYSAISALSLESRKKNFEKLESAMTIINETDIYKYHLKTQKNEERKHIGLIIGDNYKYSKELLNPDGTGVDIYSMCAVAFKALKEQQEQINLLKEEIKFLKDRKE